VTLSQLAGTPTRTPHTAPTQPAHLYDGFVIRDCLVHICAMVIAVCRRPENARGEGGRSLSSLRDVRRHHPVATPHPRLPAPSPSRGRASPHPCREQPRSSCDMRVARSWDWVYDSRGRSAAGLLPAARPSVRELNSTQLISAAHAAVTGDT